MDDFVYAKREQRKIDAINREISRLEHRKAMLERKKDEIAVGQSPIKSGDVIEWESGSRLRRGKVVTVRPGWRGFEYRCRIIAKNGRAIGWAMVNSEKYPTLLGITILTWAGCLSY